jgi:hypothetical protein
MNKYLYDRLILINTVRNWYLVSSTNFFYDKQVYLMLCYIMLFYVVLCCVMLCYVMLCYVMLCYVMLCYVILNVKRHRIKLEIFCSLANSCGTGKHVHVIFRRHLTGNLLNNFM